LFEQRATSKEQRQGWQWQVWQAAAGAAFVHVHAFDLLRVLCGCALLKNKSSLSLRAVF
jgi:hypothetical protein